MHGKAIALFDFQRENENELPLVEGQVILVSYRHGQGWLVAQNPISGESGLVPEEYVRLLRELNLTGDAEGWPTVQSLGISGAANRPYDQQDPYTTESETPDGHALYSDHVENASVTSPWTPHGNNTEALTPTQAHHSHSHSQPGHERDGSGTSYGSSGAESRAPQHSTSNSNASASSSTTSATSSHSGGGHYVPVVSTFSTSSKDFEIMHGRAMSTPALKIPASLQGRRSSEDKRLEGRRSEERRERGRIQEEESEEDRETVDTRQKGPDDAKEKLEGGR